MPPKFLDNEKNNNSQIIQKINESSKIWEENETLILYNENKNSVINSFNLEEDEKKQLNYFIDKISEYNPYEIPNIKQLESIITTNWPIFVVAGPGTGKTAILTKRFSYLAYKGIDPERILCLTFTNTGVDEMKNRIEKYLKKLEIKKENINVKTFHKFCLDAVNGTNGFQLITEQKEKEIIKDILLGQEFSYLFTGKDINKQVEPIYLMIKKLKSKKITPIDLKNLMIKNDIIFEEEFNNTERMVIREFKNLYQTYNGKIKEENLYGLEEIIDYMLNEFENKESILLDKIKKSFDYIMIDEYQDTSPNQNEIIKYITGINEWNKSPNLFVVWDDDQSIFKFQGADVENMQNLKNILKKSSIFKQITLSENYRSNQNILDIAGYSIKFNDNRLDPNKKLISSNWKIKNNKIKIIEFEKQSDEINYLCGKVIEFIKDKENKEKKIWILAPTNNNFKDIEEILTELNINYVKNWSCDIKGYKDTNEIYQLFNLIIKLWYAKLNYTDWMAEFDFPLYDSHFDTLNKNLFNIIKEKKIKEEYQISLFDLVKISNINLYREIKFIKEEGQENKEENNIIEYEKEEEKYKKIVKFYTEVKNKNLSHATFTEKLYYIFWMNRKKIWDEVAMKFIKGLNLEEDTLDNIQNLIIELDRLSNKFVRNKNRNNEFENNFKELFDIFWNKKIELFKFYKGKFINKQKDISWRNLKGYIEYISKESLKKEEDDKNYPKKEESNITLSTVHSSKGREYDKVFLIKTQASYWENSKDSEKTLINKKLFELADQDYFDDNDPREKRRLFYVGLTRAKEEMEITYFNKYDSGKKSSRKSIFLDEILYEMFENKEFNEKIIKEEGNDKIIVDYKTPEQEKLEQEIYGNNEFEDWIKNKLNHYKISYSSLTKIKKNPFKFFKEDILKFPKDESTFWEQIGNIVHEVLQEYFEFYKRNDETKVYSWDKSLSKKLKSRIDWNIFNYFRKSKKIISSYLQNMKDEYWVIPFKEFQLEYQINQKMTFEKEGEYREIALIWIIDKFKYKTDTDIEIYDYKMSMKEFEDMIGEYTNQLHYYYLINELVGLKTEKLYIDFFSQNKEIHERKEIEFDKEVLENIKTNIINIKINYFDKLEFPVKYKNYL